MRSRAWLLLAVGLFACNAKHKEQPVSAGSAADVVGPSVAVVPADTAPQIVGCEGWRARKVEHMGMGSLSESLECANGTITRTSLVDQARGEVEESKSPVTRARWEQLWRDLEAAGWRTLADDCPAPATPPESFTVTELELEISDGKLTKTVKCEGPNVTAMHEKIMSALDTE